MEGVKIKLPKIGDGCGAIGTKVSTSCGVDIKCIKSVDIKLSVDGPTTAIIEVYVSSIEVENE